MDFAALLMPFTPLFEQVKLAGALQWAQEQRLQAAVDTLPVLRSWLAVPISI